MIGMISTVVFVVMLRSAVALHISEPKLQKRDVYINHVIASFNVTRIADLTVAVDDAVEFMQRGVGTAPPTGIIDIDDDVAPSASLGTHSHEKLPAAVMLGREQDLQHLHTKIKQDFHPQIKTMMMIRCRQMDRVLLHVFQRRDVNSTVI